MLRVGARFQGRASYEGELQTASARKGESKMGPLIEESEFSEYLAPN